MDSKIDYQKILEGEIKKIDSQNIRPKLLLHACCGPCSSYVMEYLASHFDITIYYYNPNIFPPAEYERRLQELKDFLPRFPPAVMNKIKLVQEHYNPEEFYQATNARNEPNLQTEAERGERCRRCYELRLAKAYEYASNNNFDYFTTTLSISPHKDSKMINQIGSHLEENGKILFLHSDFKKKNAYLRSLELSREYNLYRQDYCGCVYSKINTEAERKKSLHTQNTP